MPYPFSVGQIYTAADANSVASYEISTQTFSAQTQVDFIGVFSSNFPTYKIIFHEYTCSAAGEMIFRLRDGSGAIATANYDMSRLESTGTAPGDTKNAFTYVAQTSWTMSYLPASTTAGAGIAGTMDLYLPNEAKYTRFTGQVQRSDNATGGIYNVTSSGMFRLTTQMTGFSLIRAGAGTITGRVSVYGWTV